MECSCLLLISHEGKDKLRKLTFVLCCNKWNRKTHTLIPVFTFLLFLFKRWPRPRLFWLKKSLSYLLDDPLPMPPQVRKSSSIHLYEATEMEINFWSVIITRYHLIWCRNSSYKIVEHILKRTTTFQWTQLRKIMIPDMSPKSRFPFLSIEWETH